MTKKRKKKPAKKAAKLPTAAEIRGIARIMRGFAGALAELRSLNAANREDLLRASKAARSLAAHLNREAKAFETVRR